MRMKVISKTFWLLLSGLCGLFLFVGGPGADPLRSVKELWDIGHIVCFALWGYGYATWRRGAFLKVGVEVIILSLCVGALTELIQSQIGRSPSFSDVMSDLFGGALGYLLYCFWRYKASCWYAWLALVVASVFSAVLVAPTAKTVADDFISWRQFPVMADFESPFEYLRWSGSAGRRVVGKKGDPGQHRLRVTFSTQRYSGIALRSTQADWRGFSVFRLTVFNPADAFTMHLRIEDRLHDNSYSDRYNHSVVIEPGENLIEIPLKKIAQAPKLRQLDLGQIRKVGLFVGKLTVPKTVYIDDVALISSPN